MMGKKMLRKDEGIRIRGMEDLTSKQVPWKLDSPSCFNLVLNSGLNCGIPCIWGDCPSNKSISFFKSNNIHGILLSSGTGKRRPWV